ncbi:metallophosphoesterase [Aquabacterium soli]|uniref:Metallophosphoesterase n=1 Tax=Aquabacterium soli TaxID=2493092 RepID=A0A426VFT6_9BURK|nr:metallophosphoesterase [Aquabacterium soli]RRS05715.1 metallophosphoesterase [Aquabacterium soli]
MSLGFLFALSALVHAYVGWRLAPYLPLWGFWGLGAVLTASALLVPLSLVAFRLRDRRAKAWVSWSGLLFMGLFSSLFVLTLGRDLLLGLAHGIQWMTSGWPGRALLAPFASLSAQAVPLLALLASLLGFLNARRTAGVVRVDVPIAGLPQALHGFTIAQISDIHVGPTIRRGYLQAIVDRVNALQADAVAITGDLVDGSVAELAEHVAPLAALRSRHGSFFVTGNHEYYSGVHAWIDELRRLDVAVLLNEHVVLERNGAALVLAGVADHGAHHFDPAHRSDPAKALANAPAHAGVKVLLAHQPRSATLAVEAGFDLQLSGHTHGGQFWPWNLFVPMQQPYTAGLHRLRELSIYVSRGTGYWGPPKRFGAPSEITHLRLVSAAD